MPNPTDLVYDFQYFKHGKWVTISYSWFLECVRRKILVRRRHKGASKWIEYKGNPIDPFVRTVQQHYYKNNGKWVKCSMTKYYKARDKVEVKREVVNPCSSPQSSLNS